MADVTIYTRESCGYCQAAMELLRRKNVDFERIEVTESAIRQAMIQRANGRTTVPQIFIGGQHVGGCDDLYALEEEGKLDALLAAA